MSSISPTTEGFRLVIRRPAIPLAEIAWRWSFGAAAWFLGAMYLFEYANSLPVNTVDRLLLATNQPILIARAIRRIFEGSAFRFTQAGILLAVALILAWVLLASIGRVATVNALIEELGIIPSTRLRRKTLSSLMTLNFLRAAVTLAAIVAGLGSVALTSSLWASTRLSVADAARFWFALLFLAWAAWTVLNWFLSTAAVFVIVKQESPLTAVLSTMKLCQSQTGGVLISGTWIELAHLGILIGALGAGFTVLGAVGVLHIGPVLFLEFWIAVLYFAGADFFYTARLAAYVVMIGGPQTADSGHTGNVRSGPPAPDAIDQSELILSDMPLPAC